MRLFVVFSLGEDTKTTAETPVQSSLAARDAAAAAARMRHALHSTVVSSIGRSVGAARPDDDGFF